jgi:hypothetical protein
LAHDQSGQDGDTASAQSHGQTGVREYARLGVEAERPYFIDDAHGKALKMPATVVAGPGHPTRRSRPHLEQHRNESNFIAYAEFFHDFVDERGEDWLRRPSIANQ